MLSKVEVDKEGVVHIRKDVEEEGALDSIPPRSLPHCYLEVLESPDI